MTSIGGVTRSVRPVITESLDWAPLGRAHPALDLVVLIGSQATRTAHEGSDTDLGVLGGPGLDLFAVHADVVAVLGSDRVDVVDLERASAVLRRDAAASGRPLFERTPGRFVDFQLEASQFWCDAGSVINEAHQDVLRAFA